MKKNILKLALILVAGIVLYSCSKDNEALPIEANTTQTFTESRTTLNGCTVDSDNPYNYVGEIHNEIIQTFVNEYPEGIRDLSRLALTIDDMALSNNNYRQKFGDSHKATNPQVLIDGMRDFENNFHGMIDNIDTSREVKDRLKQLIDFMLREGNSEKEPNYTNFDSELARFERGIMDSNDFNQEEKKLLLYSTSVARNSSCFWNNYYNTGNRASSQTQDGVSMKRKWWQWVIVAAADVGGTMAGTVATGISASGAAHTYTDPDKK